MEIDSASENTLLPKNQESPVPQIPEVITADWVDRVLKDGYMVDGEKRLFVREYPDPQKRVFLSDEFGMPEPGPEGKGYIFHGTNIETLPQILRIGLFGR